MIEWLEKAELTLTCTLRSVTELENGIPLRLTGGAFSVYQQLSEEQKRDPHRIKEALLTAFAVDKFSAYDQSICRKLKMASQ